MTQGAVIFDLDGTLVHSAPDLHAAAVAMLADLARPAITLEQVTGFVGNGVPKLVERCLRATGGVPDDGGEDALARFGRHYSRDPIRLTRPYPGVPDMLDRLRAAGRPMGVCTNKPQAATHQVLSGLEMADYFGAVVGGDTLAVRKPDPAPLMRVLALLGADPDRAVYVGDSETDAATAKAAGMVFALYTGGYRKTPVQDLPHDLAFDRFEDLSGWLAARAAG